MQGCLRASGQLCEVSYEQRGRRATVCPRASLRTRRLPTTRESTGVPRLVPSAASPLAAARHAASTMVASTSGRPEKRGVVPLQTHASASGTAAQLPVQSPWLDLATATSSVDPDLLARVVNASFCSGRDRVVITVSAAWCPACRRTEIDLNKLAEAFSDDPVAFFKLSPDIAQSVLRHHKIRKIPCAIVFERAAPTNALLFPLPLGTASRLPDLYDLLYTTAAFDDDALLDGMQGESAAPSVRCELWAERGAPLDAVLRASVAREQEDHGGGVGVDS